MAYAHAPHLCRARPRPAQARRSPPHACVRAYGMGSSRIDYTLLFLALCKALGLSVRLVSRLEDGGGMARSKVRKSASCQPRVHSFLERSRVLSSPRARLPAAG